MHPDDMIVCHCLFDVEIYFDNLFSNFVWPLADQLIADGLAHPCTKRGKLHTNMTHQK